MNLKVMWNKEEYNNFIKYLYSLQDIKYKSFHSKLILTDNLIGIRTPLLKSIAHTISKNDYTGFIKLNNHNFYEEKIIHGLILGYLKKDFNETIELFNNFINYIDNWAICDITCANMKIFINNQTQGLNIINDYLKNNNPWINRVGIVLLLDFYINDNYIDYILTKVNTINNDNYYVKMSISWLISTCYIKYPNKTLYLFKNKKLDSWIHNKSIQKIIESKRISKIDKDNLRKLKIN